MHKSIYKLEMASLKFITSAIALAYFLNSILSYFYVDTYMLSIIGGMSILPMLFLYISSFAFHFCVCHRIPIYYVAVCDLINYADYCTGGLPVSNRELLLLNIIVAGLFLLMAILMRFGICRH